LIGIPIGFSFLALSYISLGVGSAFSSLEQLGNWLHLSLAAYGFGFLATTYLFQSKRGWFRFGRFSKFLFSLLLVLAAYVVLLILVPLLKLPSYELGDELFKALDLGLLGYVIARLYINFQIRPRKGSLVILFGFGFIALGEYTHLIWALEGGDWNFIFMLLWRIVGLLILTFTLARQFHQ
jgi:hypothetical protein